MNKLCGVCLVSWVDEYNRQMQNGCVALLPHGIAVSYMAAVDRSVAALACGLLYIFITRYLYSCPVPLILGICVD
jgi:hypothetical protein